MNKTQESIRSMLIAVRDDMNTNIAVWTASAGATAAVTKLSLHITNIDISMGQQTDTKGVTITKGSKRNTLVAKIVKVANALVALGNATSNFTLAGQAKVTKSRLDTMPDTQLADKGQSIRTLGNANVAALAGYNIVAADITALQAAITAFNADIQKPKNVIGSIKAFTSQLKNELVFAITHLENVLDPIVRTYNETSPAFVTEYFNNRIIYNVGFQKLAARFIIDESAGHLPLANVQIDITPGDIKKKTAAKGIALVKTLAQGTYSVTLNKPGFANQTFNINIVDGETTIVVKSMVAV